jgi:enoyl-CoA hydratase
MRESRGDATASTRAALVHSHPMRETTWELVGEHLTSARSGDVVVLRLDRPEKLNALTLAMVRDLATAVRVNATTARGLVLTGAGRAFSAGDDLDATAGLDAAGFEALTAGFQDMTRAVLTVDVPVVAALNGLAVGGAAELALACDARIGSDSATWYFPENGVGLTISNGSTYLLPRVLGSRALPLILDAGRVEANEALRLGLLTEVVDDPVARAIEVVTGWTADGRATRWHLRLLRPDIAAVEHAMARETEAAREVFAAGIATAGAAAFGDRRRRTR